MVYRGAVRGEYQRDVQDAFAQMQDAFAQMASLNNRLRELSKEVVWLNGMVWEMWKKQEKGNGP